MWEVYVKIPLIIFILSILVIFILGSIIAVDLIQILCNTNTRFGAWIIWILIGLLSSFITYFINKLLIAPTILIVEHLKKISEKNDKEM